MSSTRTLEPWEVVKPDDTYNRQPVGDALAGVQASSFLFPVTRRLTITLDIDDVRALTQFVPPEQLPHCRRSLVDLIAEAEAES